MDSLQKLLEEREVKELGVVLIEKARNQGLWNSMIAKFNRYGTERERERESLWVREKKDNDFSIWDDWWKMQSIT